MLLAILGPMPPSSDNSSRSESGDRSSRLRRFPYLMAVRLAATVPTSGMPRAVSSRSKLRPVRACSIEASRLSALRCGHAWQPQQLLALPMQRKDVGQVAHQARVDQLLDQRVAEAVDVHARAAREVEERRLESACAAWIRAAQRRLALDATHRAAAGGAVRRRLPALGALGARLEHHLDHLRDDLARLLDQHRVADAHVLAVDHVEVVQRGARDDGAAERDRHQVRHGRERAGAPDVCRDGEHARGLALGSELVGDGPAWKARGGPELLALARAGRP